MPITKEEISLVPVIEEAGDHWQDFLDLFDGKSKKNYIPVLEIQQPSSVSESSTTTLLLSSIQTLSTLPTGVPPPPSLSQLYHTVTTATAPISSCPFQNPMTQPNTEESQLFRIPLHIPSFSLLSTSISNNILVHPSSLPDIGIVVSSSKTSTAPLISSTSE